jgi:thiol-disulfide isomerase/thioredoxin
MNIDYPCSKFAAPLNQKRMMAKRLSRMIGRILYIVIALVATSPACATPPELPPSSVILIWAAWCAPCRTEIADFERLALAARPRNAIVWATDDDNRSRAMLVPIPSAQLRFVPESLPVLYGSLGIQGPVALPLSLLTDAQGHICATIRGGATVSKIEQAKRECGPN